MALSDSDIARMVKLAGEALQSADARRASFEDWCSDCVAPTWRSMASEVKVRQRYPDGRRWNDLEVHGSTGLVAVVEAKRWADQRVLNDAAKLRCGYSTDVQRLLLLTGGFPTDKPLVRDWIAGLNARGLNGRWRTDWQHCFKVRNPDKGRYEAFFYTVIIELI